MHMWGVWELIWQNFSHIQNKSIAPDRAGDRILQAIIINANEVNVSSVISEIKKYL